MVGTRRYGHSYPHTPTGAAQTDHGCGWCLVAYLQLAGAVLSYVPGLVGVAHMSEAELNITCMDHESPALWSWTPDQVWVVGLRRVVTVRTRTKGALTLKSALSHTFPAGICNGTACSKPIRFRWGLMPAVTCDAELSRSCSIWQAGCGHMRVEARAHPTVSEDRAGNLAWTLLLSAQEARGAPPAGRGGVQNCQGVYVWRS